MSDFLKTTLLFFSNFRRSVSGVYKEDELSIAESEYTFICGFNKGFYYAINLVRQHAKELTDIGSGDLDHECARVCDKIAEYLESELEGEEMSEKEKAEQFLEARGYQKCIEMLRSEEANKQSEAWELDVIKFGNTIANSSRWANWLESVNPYLGEKEKERKNK